MSGRAGSKTRRRAFRLYSSLALAAGYLLQSLTLCRIPLFQL